MIMHICHFLVKVINMWILDAVSCGWNNIAFIEEIILQNTI